MSNPPNNIFTNQGGNKPSPFGAQNTSNQPNMFSNTQTSNTQGNPFGQNNTQPPAQSGATTGAGLFANNNPTPGGGLFGGNQQATTNQPGVNIFNAANTKPADSNPLFNKPAQNQPSTTGGGLFPNQSIGQTPTNQTQPNNLFGQKTQPTTPAQTGGLFGGNTVPQSG